MKTKTKKPREWTLFVAEPSGSHMTWDEAQRWMARGGIMTETRVREITGYASHRPAFLRGARWLLSEASQYLGTETIVRLQEMILAKGRGKK